MTEDIDPFAVVAEEGLCNPRRAQLRANAKRAERKRMKEIIDGDTQFRMWKKWHAAQRAKLAKGKYHVEIAILSAALENLTMNDGPELIALVKQGPWHEADADTRYIVLSLIDHRICYMREQAGLAPFSDSLPFLDQEPTVFEICRAHLGDIDTQT